MTVFSPLVGFLNVSIICICTVECPMLSDTIPLFSTSFRSLTDVLNILFSDHVAVILRQIRREKTERWLMRDSKILNYHFTVVRKKLGSIFTISGSVSTGNRVYCIMADL